MALRSGNYDQLRKVANTTVIDSIKSQRTRKLQGLRLSWKLHKVIEQEIVCARQQEISKVDEHVAQCTVRFITEQVRLAFICSLLPRSLTTVRVPQSLEIRDGQGKLLGKGNHDAPERVTEVRRCISRSQSSVADLSLLSQYFVFQRDMWRPDDEWMCVKRGAKETDLIANPEDQA